MLAVGTAHRDPIHAVPTGPGMPNGPWRRPGTVPARGLTLDQELCKARKSHGSLERGTAVTRRSVPRAGSA